MPKLLVLFEPGPARAAHVADAIVAGARSVRFTEADVRRLGGAPAGVDASHDAGGASRHRALEQVERLADHDAFVLVVDAAGTADAPAARLLADARSLAASGALGYTVAGAVAIDTTAGGGVAAAPPALLAAIAELGVLLVPPPFAQPGSAAGADEDARRLGVRIATVAEWVRHARSHEAGDAHGHAHGHSHGHAHGHAHGDRHSHGHGH